MYLFWNTLIDAALAAILSPSSCIHFRGLDTFLWVLLTFFAALYLCCSDLLVYVSHTFGSSQNKIHNRACYNNLTVEEGLEHACIWCTGDQPLALSQNHLVRRYLAALHHTLTSTHTHCFTTDTQILQVKILTLTFVPLDEYWTLLVTLRTLETKFLILALLVSDFPAIILQGANFIMKHLTTKQKQTKRMAISHQSIIGAGP